MPNKKVTVLVSPLAGKRSRRRLPVPAPEVRFGPYSRPEVDDPVQEKPADLLVTDFNILGIKDRPSPVQVGAPPFTTGFHGGVRSDVVVSGKKLHWLALDNGGPTNYLVVGKAAKNPQILGLVSLSTGAIGNGVPDSQRLAVGDGVAFVLNTDIQKLQVVDVSDPLSPAFISTTPLNSGAFAQDQVVPRQVQARGRVAYVVTREYSTTPTFGSYLCAYEAAGDFTLSQISAYPLPVLSSDFSGFVQDVKIRRHDDALYVSLEDYVLVFDVSTGVPVLAATVATTNRYGSNDLVAAGDRLFDVRFSGTTSPAYLDQVDLYDVSDRLSPVYVATLVLGGMAARGEPVNIVTGATGNYAGHGNGATEDGWMYLARVLQPSVSGFRGIEVVDGRAGALSSANQLSRAAVPRALRPVDTTGKPL